MLTSVQLVNLVWVTYKCYCTFDDDMAARAVNCEARINKELLIA